MHGDCQIQKYHIDFVLKSLYLHPLFSEMEDDYL